MALTFPEFDTKCKKTIEHLKIEMQRVRTGRASTSLLEGITVEYYGSQVPLIQLGMIAAPESRMLTIQVYDSSACEAIERAIHQSELGLNPMREGNLIRLAIPSLNEERRKEFIKKIHKIGEETRVGLRNHRRDQLTELKKKAKEVSQDEIKRAEDDIQKITDKYIKDVDVVIAAKEKELMEV